MLNNASPFILVSLVVLRKYVFGLRKVEKDRSLVHVITGRVKNIWGVVHSPANPTKHYLRKTRL